MNAFNIALTLASVLLIGCSQILFKVAARDAAFAGFTWRTVVLWATPAMLGALVLSTIATGLWVWVLRTASLSIAYPIYALTFVVVPLLDLALFGGHVALRYWIGSGAIIVGVWLMTGMSAASA